MTSVSLDKEALDSLVLLNEDALDWRGAISARYIIHQHFRYEYPGPIADLRHRLIVVPRGIHGDQRRLAQRVDISPKGFSRTFSDGFGNRVIAFALGFIDGALEFEHWSIVERTPQGAQTSRHRVGPAAFAAPELRGETALTAPGEELREAARALRREHSNPLELAEAINQFVHREMTYSAGTTNVETPAVEAFAQRKGVCQDFAHVMLGIARDCGLAARYVSGHLLGEGGTHAWVEVLIPDATGGYVVALDPTHACRTTLGYIVVAVGRDYADVAPTSGAFSAPYNGALHTRKRVGVTGIEYAAA